MTKETPKWLQAGSYAARLDRHVIEELFRRKNRVMRGLQVIQRTPGPTGFFVDITPGTGVVIGTTQVDQGGYLVRSSGVANEPLNATTTPGAPRTDSIYLIVRDPNAGGPVGDDFYFAWVNGGAAVPAGDVMLLATVARTTSETGIVNAAITDMRPLGEWSWTVGTAAPTALAPDGDLYVQVT